MEIPMEIPVEISIEILEIAVEITVEIPVEIPVEIVMVFVITRLRGKTNPFRFPLFFHFRFVVCFGAVGAHVGPRLC